jgi:type I restriction enzyme S subunit
MAVDSANLTAEIKSASEQLQQVEVAVGEDGTDGLPEGWIKLKLGDFTAYGKTKKVERDDVDASLWLLELEDVEKESSKILQRLSVSERAFKSTKNQFKKGAVLYGKLRPYLNKVVIAPEDGVCTTEIIPLDVEPLGSNKYLFYWLKSAEFLDHVKKSSYGVNMPRLGTKDGLAAPFILPPLAEQTVIAQTLGTLLGQVDNIKTRLDAIPEILKTFRQSVLAAAVSGKLTEEWRDGKELDAKSDLVRECGYSDGKSKKVENTSSHEIVTGSFPDSWGVSTFTNLYKFIDYRGKTPKKSETGKRLYTAKNIKMGYIKNSPIEFLSDEDYVSWMTRGFSKLGDIFFVTEGHTMGCVAINELGSDIALAQRTLTLQPFGRLKTKFHYYFMLTESFQKLVDLNATGTAAKGIKAAKFRGLPLPFPSYEEQTKIIDRVEELFAFAGQIEQQVKNALKRVDNLPPSILEKAFCGELTTQWRTDNSGLITGENSAQALLAAIQAEREKIKVKKVSGKRK